MDVRDFDFDLPPELIAQEPIAERSEARLLVLSRATGVIAHKTVADLPRLLERGDLLVVNNSRVIPARLLGRRVPSGGAVECLLIRRLSDSDPTQSGIGVGSELGQSWVRVGIGGEVWEALMHPGQKLKPGAGVEFGSDRKLHGEVLERQFFGRRTVRLWTDDGPSVDEAIDRLGHVPLPPYIKRDDRDADRDRYQTIFADPRGSVAAPTAGLHFTPALLDALAAAGVDVARITLHVGYGTFQPVRVERVEDHRLDAEWFTIDPPTADQIERARRDRRRIIAVGTTTTRTLESAARGQAGGAIKAESGSTDLFIYPGFDFQVIDGLLTNFHLPQSSLLMLVSAFAGRDRVLAAYADAVRERYRFYSYGDAMLII